MTLLPFFQFTDNLEQLGSQIPVIISLTVTFYLTKTENRTKKSLTQPKNTDFAKNADISKIRITLVVKGTFFETTYSKCLRAKFEVSNITLTSFKTWG